MGLIVVEPEYLLEKKKKILAKETQTIFFFLLKTYGYDATSSSNVYVTTILRRNQCNLYRTTQNFEHIKKKCYHEKPYKEKKNKEEPQTVVHDSLDILYEACEVVKSRL